MSFTLFLKDFLVLYARIKHFLWWLLSMSQKIKGSVHYTEPPSVELVSPLLNLAIMLSVLGHLHLSLSPQTFSWQGAPLPGNPLPRWPASSHLQMQKWSICSSQCHSDNCRPSHGVHWGCHLTFIIARFLSFAYSWVFFLPSTGVGTKGSPPATVSTKRGLRKFTVR